MRIPPLHRFAAVRARIIAAHRLGAWSLRSQIMLEHSFNGPPFTIGIEEELMLLDAGDLSLAQAIEAVLEAVPPDREGQIKPELMQSVLEIATKPCQTVKEAGEELR